MADTSYPVVQGETVPMQSDTVSIQGETVPIRGGTVPIQGETVPAQPELASPAPVQEAQQVEVYQEKARVPDVLDPQYYVTLQSLSLDLIAAQLERLNINFSQEERLITASWPTFFIEIRATGQGWLTLRATITRAVTTQLATELIGRCNRWNQTETFLKASCRIVVINVADEGETDGGEATPYTRVCLDLELPMYVGVAPVQLQSLIRETVANVYSFERFVRFDDLLQQLNPET